MKIAKLIVSLLAGMGAGCATLPPSGPVSTAALPNCLEANYDASRDVFTMRNAAGTTVNQQCLLTVGMDRSQASASRIAPGNYAVYLANGGGGGAGGTLQAFAGGGGGGGGGAGALETRSTVYLSEGQYKLTLGAGGPGGNACMQRPSVIGGGPGWPGSPSSMVRIETGEVLAGTAGADTYVRTTRRANEKAAGPADGHGGSGPGQTSGGHGAAAATDFKPRTDAESGGGKISSAGVESGGNVGQPAPKDKQSGFGGGGGATTIGLGGGGGGESPGQRDIPPKRGSLGSGGGGGEGSMSECDPGAQGGHGYIALRPL